MTSRWIASGLLLLGAAVVLGTTAGPARAANVVTIRVGSYYFEDGSVGDGVVTAQVGDQLRFVFDDSGHSADVDALGISTGTLGSGAVFVTSPITQAGTFELYCRPHRRLGHRTNLVVTGVAATTTTTTSTTTTTTVPVTTTTAPTTAPATTAPASRTTTTTTRPPGTTLPGRSTTTVAGAVETITTQPIDVPTSVGSAVVSPGDDDGGSLDGDAAMEMTPLTPGGSSEVERGSDGSVPDVAGAHGEHSDAASGAVDAADPGVGGALPPVTSPVGLLSPSSTVWLRSVWASVFAGVPILAVAVVAVRRSRRPGTPRPD